MLSTEDPLQHKPFFFCNSTNKIYKVIRFIKTNAKQ